MTIFSRGKGLRALPMLALAAMLVLPVAGCNTDEIVAVTDPEELRPEDLTGLAAVPALVNGAIRQFSGGYSGFGGDAFLSMSAVITDEFYYGDTFTTRQAADRRTLQPPVLGNISDGAFASLHQARFNARRAYSLVEEFTSAATATADANTQAQLRAVEGYTYVTLSEGWCGAVPFSRMPDTGPIDPTAVEEGPPIGTNAMNDSAVVRFDQALARNPANRLAAMGKARALLNLGRYADASTAVAAVPTTFVFFLEHSPNSGAQNNPIASLMLNGRYGIANLEGADSPTGTLRPDAPTSGFTAPPTTGAGAEGLAFRGLQDPRVPYQGRPSSGNGCFTASVRCWLNNNYPDLEADVPLASGIEARLIEAEAAYQAGDFVTMLLRLNTLRAAAAAHIARLYPRQVQVFSTTLAPLVDPGTSAGRRDMIFSERALWLFNTGHRQGDLRRLIRNYGLPSASVFPSGPNFRGGTFGNDVNYPVPFTEENNTKFQQAACVTTQA
ncbi:MAG: tetratricopeptide repeat protein [Gemmatimonadaceae bacterium]